MENLRDGNIQVVISKSDLMSCLREAISEVRKEFERDFLAKKTEKYIRPAEAAEKLSVDRSTLWRWAKTGYLTPIEVGGKRLYRQSDLEKLLEG